MRILVLLCGLLLIPLAIKAQSPPPPSCEVQLEEARTVNILLRKQKAQAEFQAANNDESIMAMSKKIAELEAKSKSAEKK